jgi:hypothetical protein
MGPRRRATSALAKIELSANGDQTDYEECLSCQ